MVNLSKRSIPYVLRGIDIKRNIKGAESDNARKYRKQPYNTPPAFEVYSKGNDNDTDDYAN